MDEWIIRIVAKDNKAVIGTGNWIGEWNRFRGLWFLSLFKRPRHLHIRIIIYIYHLDYSLIKTLTFTKLIIRVRRVRIIFTLRDHRISGKIAKDNAAVIVNGLAWNRSGGKQQT